MQSYNLSNDSWSFKHVETRIVSTNAGKQERVVGEKKGKIIIMQFLNRCII